MSGCGPGADLPAFATAVGGSGHVIGVDNATLGRQLARLAMKAGFRVGKVIPITAVFRDAQAADQVPGIQRVTGRAVKARHLTQESATRWLTYLATQPFFASTTLYIITATAN